MNRILSKRIIKYAALVGWLVAVGGGMWQLCAYSFAPGEKGAAPLSWPADSALTRDSDHFSAVLVLHPECECSEATLEELADVVEKSAGKLNAQLLFVQLPGLPPVEESKLWLRAQRITGARLVRDVAGVQARHFGARTSGEVRLYGPEGRLRFTGGITMARGHVGDNPGASALLKIMAQSDSPRVPITTPVFGCALWDECAPASS